MKRLLCLLALMVVETAAGGAESLRFVVTADTQGSDGNGVNSTVLAEIVQATISEGADFIIVAGDLVDGSSGQGTFESQLLHWRDIMQPLYDANVDVYPVRGNHDTGGNPKTDWDNVFTGEYALPDNGPSGEKNVTYSFTHENAFIVGLDQYTNIHRINQAWLDEQLGSNTKPHVFVFGHEPAFKLFHWDCLGEYPDERDIFWNSIVAAGARVYFCGHDHSYDHARIDEHDGNPNNDVHQFVALGGGDLFYTGGLYDGDNGSWTPRRLDHADCVRGYILVEIDGADATLSWKRRTGVGEFEVGDVFSYTAGPVDAVAVSFADSALKAAIEAELGISKPNTTDILNLVSLDANSMGIAELTGLQYAVNLATVYLDENLIGDVYALSGLTNLAALHLEGNALDRAAYCVYLPLIAGNNPGIDLTCEPNPNPDDTCIVDFSDANLKTAVEQELGICDPNFADMLNLTYMTNGNLRGIGELTGLEHARKLAWLDLNLNHIADVAGISKLKELTRLGLQGNQISDISALSALPYLTQLWLGNNQVSEISSLSRMNITLLQLDNNPLNTAAYCRHLPSISSNNPAIELTCDANPNPLTCDCSANWHDLGMLSERWLEEDCAAADNWCGGADLNHLDGVNFADLAELLQYWLMDASP